MAAPLVIFYCRFATVSSLKMHIENERSLLARARVPPFNLGKMTMMLIGGIEHVLLLLLLAVLDKGRIIACFMKGLYSISRCWSENSYNSLSLHSALLWASSSSLPCCSLCGAYTTCYIALHRNTLISRNEEDAWGANIVFDVAYLFEIFGWKSVHVLTRLDDAHGIFGNLGNNSAWSIVWILRRFYLSSDYLVTS